MEKKNKILLTSIIFFFCIVLFSLFFFSIKYSYILFKSILKENYDNVTILYIPIVGEYSENPTSDPLFDIFKDEVNSTEDIIQAINKAKYDNSIQTIFLNISPSNLGWARVSELRNSLESFKTEKKEIFVFLNNPGDKEYFLASIADSIFLSPTGNLKIDGLSSTIFFVSNLMEKIGVKCEIIKAGKFKSATEIFTDTIMSTNNRIAIERLLFVISEKYINSVDSSRKNRLKENFRSIISKGPYLSSSEILDLGLIDRLETYNNIVYHLEIDKLSITPKNYLVSLSNSISFDNPIALIYIEGEIRPGENKNYQYSDFAGADELTRNIMSVAEDTLCKAIVIRVNSPGGDLDASYALGQAIAYAKKFKPVIISMGDMAASGGYFLAMYGDVIVASEETVTGSIGVFFIKPDFSELLSNIGISIDTVNTEKMSDFLSPFRNLSDEEKEKLQTYIDEAYNLFISEVSLNRKLDISFVDSISQGRVWSGYDAFNFGLIDSIGDLKLAVDIAKENAGIPADQKVRVSIYPKPTLNYYPEYLYSSLLSEFPILKLLFVKNIDIKNYYSRNEMQIKYLLPFNLCIE